MARIRAGERLYFDFFRAPGSTMNALRAILLALPMTPTGPADAADLAPPDFESGVGLVAVTAAGAIEVTD